MSPIGGGLSLLAVARTAPTSVGPAAAPGLRLWLEPSKETQYAADAPIGSLTDWSGNGNHATQATAGNRPVYKTGVLNGLPVARFDGSNDYVAPAAIDLTGTAAVTVYMIFSAASGADMVFCEFGENYNTLTDDVPDLPRQFEPGQRRQPGEQPDGLRLDHAQHGGGTDCRHVVVQGADRALRHGPQAARGDGVPQRHAKGRGV